MKSWCGIALMWCAAFATLTFSACSYDDGNLWNSVNDLDSRVKTLEEQVKTLNTNYTALAAAVKALEENVSIRSIEELADKAGYKIIFTDNTSITLTNGKNGKDGEAGKDGAAAPVIGVKQDLDGVYYWTLTTEKTTGDTTEKETNWLLDSNGNKMPVSGNTPMIGVDANGFWTISYDKGVNYTLILDAAGKPIPAKADSTLLKSITSDNDYVYITLNDADGTVLKLLKDGAFNLTIEGTTAINGFAFSETRTFNVTSTGVSRVVLNKPSGWKANLNNGVLSVTAPVDTLAAYVDLSGEVSLIYFNNNGLSRVAAMNVAVSPAQ